MVDDEWHKSSKTTEEMQQLEVEFRERIYTPKIYSYILW